MSAELRDILAGIYMMDNRLDNRGKPSAEAAYGIADKIIQEQSDYKYELYLEDRANRGLGRPGDDIKEHMRRRMQDALDEIDYDVHPGHPHLDNL